MKHWEVIPIVFIVTIGFGIEVLTWLIVASTRMDLHWTRQPPPCEVVYTTQSPIDKPPKRKFAVYNQKYIVPKGLLIALQGEEICPMEEPPAEEHLDWYLIMGRLLPWAVWAAFLYLFDLF